MPSPGIPRHLVYAVAIDVLYPPEWGVGDDLTPDGRYIIVLAYFPLLEDASHFARSVYLLFSLPYLRREHFYVVSVNVRLSHYTGREEPELVTYHF